MSRYVDQGSNLNPPRHASTRGGISADGANNAVDDKHVPLAFSLISDSFVLFVFALVVFAFLFEGTVAVVRSCCPVAK